MSWDVLLMKLNRAINNIDDIAEDEKTSVLGAADLVRTQISQLIPDIDWSDPTWGVLERDQFSIEFSCGDEPETDSIMLHVRGAGDPLQIITEICRTNNWQAFDCSSGELINIESLSENSWQQFQAYRDQVFGKD